MSKFFIDSEGYVACWIIGQRLDWKWAKNINFYKKKTKNSKFAGKKRHRCFDEKERIYLRACTFTREPSLSMVSGWSRANFFLNLRGRKFKKYF